MLRINNKGMTTVEILVSFILVMLISASLYTTVSNYNSKMQNESYNLKINTYKNLVTKTIQDDLINIGISDAIVNSFEVHKAPDDTSQKSHPYMINVVDIYLKNKTTRRLVVESRQTDTDNQNYSIKYDDYFNIYYGEPNYNIGNDILDNRGNILIKSVQRVYNSYKSNKSNSNYNNFRKWLTTGLEEYPFPSLGNIEVMDAGGNKKRTIQDFRITNVRFENKDQVLSLFIGFNHYRIGSKYAINVVAPINYIGY